MSSDYKNLFGFLGDKKFSGSLENLSTKNQINFWKLHENFWVPGI